MAEPVTTYYLEMLSPDELKPTECRDPNVRIAECKVKQFQYNRFLYELVGSDWQWFGKRSWTDDDWRAYAESENLRTWVAYSVGAPAGYYELRRERQDIEIVYFGLARPFIGRGLGRYLLTCAIRSAWAWAAKRVWVHTCTLDHPNALANYQARGMKLYKQETTVRPPRAGLDGSA